MCVCACVFIRVCVNVCVCVWLSVWACVCKCVYLCECVSEYIWVCALVFMWVYVWVYVSLCLHECVSEPTRTQTCRDIYYKQLAHTIMEAWEVLRSVVGKQEREESQGRPKVQESWDNLQFTSRQTQEPTNTIFFFCPSSKAWKYQIITPGGFLYSAFLIYLGLLLMLGRTIGLTQLINSNVTLNPKAPSETQHYGPGKLTQH